VVVAVERRPLPERSPVLASHQELQQQVARLGQHLGRVAPLERRQQQEQEVLAERLALPERVEMRVPPRRRAAGRRSARRWCRLRPTRDRRGRAAAGSARSAR
jgi:hypothetical protein